MSIMLNIQSRVPPHNFGEKHPANPHGYVPKRSKNDFFWGELSNSGDQHIPSGTEATASIKVRIYGCNLYLLSRTQ